jgi:putative membrane protein
MKEKKYFKYIVILGVLIIPFMYSFFYLKAYWNPYGAGNIDNLPVAIVNEDDGDKGSELIKSIKDSKKLKLSVVDEDDADEGLYNKDYYAIIKIPKDFTKDMESAGTTNKHHATITYSPNQKSNYLASQIINSVVNAVEKNLDNAVNSSIVSSLSENIESVPEQLTTVSDGFGKLADGTDKLASGGNTLANGTSSLKFNYNTFNSGIKTLQDGTSSLNSNYTKFNDGVISAKNGVASLKENYTKFDEGVNNLNNGAKELENATSELSNINSSLGNLVTGVDNITSGSNDFTNNFNNYVDGVNDTLSYTELMANYLNNSVCSKTDMTDEEKQICMVAAGVTTSNSQYGNTNVTNYLKSSGSKLKTGNSQVNGGLNQLNSQVSSLSSVSMKLSLLQDGIKNLSDGATTLTNSSNQILTGINNLSTGIDTLAISSNQVLEGTKKVSDGANTLSTSSDKILAGIGSLDSGASTLNAGIITLDDSVKAAKVEIDNKIEETEKETSKVSGLGTYAKEPVKVETKEVNKVSSYGTAFSPFFISIALWVGCLMMFIVLYYDKDERFGILGINDNRFLFRTLAYHGLATVAAIVLGMLLYFFLDFEITNIFLYFIAIILTANAFMAIMEFLIVNFKDVGKFIALILLVLQLAAAGGTFPIETVTKCFRWLNSFLPMKYTIDLLRECLVSIESNLLIKNIIVVIVMFVVFFVINIIGDIIRERVKIEK